MKKSLVIATMMVAAFGVFGQGQVTFNNRLTTGGAPGSFNAPLYSPIYGINPANPQQVVVGQGSVGATPTAGLPIPVGTMGDIYAGRTPLSGTGFTAQLWYGAQGTTDESTMQLAAGATSTFRTGTTTVGAFNGTTATLTTIPSGAGSRAALQVRAWDNLNGTVTTWAGVLADNNVARGSTAIFTPNFNLGGGTDQPPNLHGMTSFGLFVPVPEPSLIALGALGLGALLLRRRKA